MTTEKENNLKINKYITKLYNDYKYLLVPFIVLFVTYFIAFMPLLRSDLSFLDDIGRINEGYTKFTFFSRYISEFGAILFHTGKYLTDISPFLQLISIVLLSLAGVIILHLFYQNKKISFLQILAVLPLGLCPYFLECISFKYDSPYMTLSLFSCIFPFIFYGEEKKKRIIFSIVTIICTIIMCTTYQASSGIIPVITIFLASKYFHKKDFKEMIRFIFTTASSFIVGLLIFRVFIMHPATTYASTSMYKFNELIPGIIHNLKKFYYLFFSDFRKLWLILLFFITVIFIFLRPKDTKQNMISIILVNSLIIILSILLIFGVFLVLEKPVFAPRSMYSIGVLISLICVSITNNKLYLPKVLTLIICYCFFVFSLTYGNMVSEQKNYTNFRIQNVINGLNELSIMNTEEIKTIYIKGDIKKAPPIENLSKSYKKLINKLIRSNFGESSYWGTYYFVNYYKIKNIKLCNNKNLIPDDLVLIKNTMYYSIEMNSNNFILITLK